VYQPVTDAATATWCKLRAKAQDSFVECNVDSAEKPGLAGLALEPWRGVACGSQRRLGRLQALQAAPLQVFRRDTVFQRNLVYRRDPLALPWA
jgi:hypothetical protein